MSDGDFAAGASSKTTLKTVTFEGRQVPFHPGDTVASALFRSGVRVFSRSFKYHRPRGLYCVSGDCPNCIVNVDGVPSVRACVTAAREGQRIERETGWPSADRDLFSVLDHVRFALPVGFYYKTLLRPRWLWPILEPLLRALAGRGSIPTTRVPERRELRHLHPDVVVIGAGVAGLSAALAAADAGRSVVLCDEGSPGAEGAPGPHRKRAKELLAHVRSRPQITLLERTPAIGIYEGPLVVLDEPAFLHLTHPRSVIVATGAVERHLVFPGNDLPGVWLGRGAARIAGGHGIPPARRVVVLAGNDEVELHAQTLRDAGVEVVVVSGDIIRARGRRRVRGVVVADDEGRTRAYRCDGLVLCSPLEPRSALARQATGLPVETVGDALEPGQSIGDVEAQSRNVAIGLAQGRGVHRGSLPVAPQEGIVCLCEDVTVKELDQAWKEGFRSTEILKRYTTATMGPCQGQMCQCHVRAFVASRPDATGPASGPTTARPPVRGITLERVSAGLHKEAHQRTSLHDRHLEAGAVMELAGPWERPRHYGNTLEEYWAVRRGVSLMDVGTLGKFLAAGADVLPFLERLYPNRVADLKPGRIRYQLLLGEHGFVIDDGLVCAPEDGQPWYLTFTSSGSANAEAVLRDWAETWRHKLHIVDVTNSWGAVNVAGPRARELLARLSSDAINNESFPYLHHRQITVAGVPCRAIRLGFVGELSYELHHPSHQSRELWDALIEAGSDLGVRPHGLDALRTLRLEKGHIIIGQDTDFDATPRKLNMDWAVKLDKPWFVGKLGLERSNACDVERKLVQLAFSGGAPPEGAPVRADGGLVGYLSSSRWSPTLNCGVALGWIEKLNGTFPMELVAEGIEGVVVEEPFYDPRGERLRA